ncbi:MAG: 6-phosphogluconolactonase [Verrucomicrobia bacterium]|nr:6-phosphogluconolactonase [Verrucomicrobiota bacterium]
MLLHEYPDAADWLDAMVAGWEALGGPALSARGTFNVSLSGGSTPKPLYDRLAALKWPWSSTRLYLGDERWVYPDHKDSNYRMIHQAFHGTGVQIERVRTEIGTAEIGAREYEKRVRTNLGDPPRFDLIILGIGDDGHTSSLFPDTTALQELKLLMAPNFVPKLGVWRVTSTYTLLRYARAIWFLTRGPSKETYIRALAADDLTASFPAAKVHSDRGIVEIYHCTQP